MSVPRPSLMNSIDIRAEHSNVENQSVASAVMTSQDVVSKGSFMTNDVIPRSTRYKNLDDLKNLKGTEELSSYIVPELKEISESIKKKKIIIQKKNDIKDEFEQMVNWKRVFE